MYDDYDDGYDEYQGMDDEDVLYREMNPEDPWYMGPEEDVDDGDDVCDWDEAEHSDCDCPTPADCCDCEAHDCDAYLLQDPARRTTEAARPPRWRFSDWGIWKFFVNLWP